MKKPQKSSPKKPAKSMSKVRPIAERASRPARKSAPARSMMPSRTAPAPLATLPAAPFTTLPVTPAPAPRIPAPKFSDFKVRPLADRVLIKEDTESKEQTTVSGIIIPISAQEDKSGKRGKVVAIGEGKMEEGQWTPVSVSVGDKVLFQWGDKIQVDNEEYYIVKESEILAVIK